MRTKSFLQGSRKPNSRKGISTVFSAEMKTKACKICQKSFQFKAYISSVREYCSQACRIKGFKNQADITYVNYNYNKKYAKKQS